MDRDRRWEREKKAFDAMVKGQAEGGAYKDAVARVKESYNNGIDGRVYCAVCGYR